MSRKCACCDTQYNLMFVPDDEDYMCGECYCEQYHRYEFNQGCTMLLMKLQMGAYTI